MEFPSDYMEDDNGPAPYVHQPYKQPTATLSPINPVVPTAKYSTAPPVLSLPVRASTFAPVSSAPKSPTSSQPKKDPIPARSATVTDKKSKRLTRSLSRMFSGRPRTAHEPLPELKTDLNPTEDLTIPVSPKLAIDGVNSNQGEEAAMLAGSDDARPVSSRSAKQQAALATLEKTASRSTAGGEQAGAPKSPLEAPALDVPTADLRPASAGSTNGAVLRLSPDFEKRKTLPPPLQTTTVLPADIAKLETLNSPTSAKSASKKGSVEMGKDRSEMAADETTAVEQGKKKKGNTGFFSILRWRKKNKMAPQVAAI